MSRDKTKSLRGCHQKQWRATELEYGRLFFSFHKYSCRFAHSNLRKKKVGFMLYRTHTMYTNAGKI